MIKSIRSQTYVQGKGMSTSEGRKSAICISHGKNVWEVQYAEGTATHALRSFLSQHTELHITAMFHEKIKGGGKITLIAEPAEEPRCYGAGPG
jgi:hypothetical protein